MKAIVGFKRFLPTEVRMRLTSFGIKITQAELNHMIS